LTDFKLFDITNIKGKLLAWLPTACTGSYNGSNLHKILALFAFILEDHNLAYELHSESDCSCRPCD